MIRYMSDDTDLKALTLVASDWQLPFPSDDETKAKIRGTMAYQHAVLAIEVMALTETVRRDPAVQRVRSLFRRDRKP